MSEAEKVNSAPFAEWFNFANSEPANIEASPNRNGTDLSALSANEDIAVDCDVSVEPESVAGSWSSVARWMESAENGGASLTGEEVATLFGFIQEIRGSNTKLLERAIQLERSLEDSQNELQHQRRRSREAELKLAQQIQDREQARSQVESLSYKLDAAEQTIERQQIAIEALTDDLNASQERIAQMERECSLVQSRYNEQSYQLMQVETSCRDLQSRLLRQQRYTMQLKVALDKCAESPASSSDRIPENNSSSFRTQSLFPNPQPITPWSIQTPNSFDCDPQNRIESSLDDWTAENFLSDRQSHYSFNSIPSTGTFDLQNNNSTTESFFLSDDREVDLEDFLSLLQEEASSSEAIADNDTSALDQIGQKAEDRGQKDDFSADAEAPPSSEASEPLQPNAAQPSQNKVNLNWPSPIVYPLHPPKGRKSLASIELPKFPPKKQ